MGARRGIERAWSGWFLSSPPRPDLEQCPRRPANLPGPAQRGGGLAFGGILAGIARSHGESSQEARPAAKRAQAAVVRQEQNDQVVKDMRIRYGLAKLFQKCF